MNPQPPTPHPAPGTKITPAEFHQAVISRLHDVVMGELFIHQGYEYYEEMLLKICDLSAGVNMQGALSPEALHKYKEHYNDDTMRRFFGTVAMNMEYYLRANYGGMDAKKKFIGNVVGSIMLDQSETTSPSETEIALLSPRIETNEAHGFENPVDFWIICFIAFRMTVGETQVYPFIRQQYDLASKGRPPAPRGPQPQRMNAS